ncbi:prepilin-type N-terminal cleavage/methylation domain-containing protein [PVC group bacterium]|nr:prepilin-type N-terminal cleavage/methylation domain-containing protein [PVC group bacterium]
MKTRKNYAFTIFELVVVLAIITTLVAMIFPVLQKARDTGRKTSCVSNLKQIGTALSMYLDDFRHRLPRVGTGRIEWANNLNNIYIDDQNLFYCPTAPGNSKNWTNLDDNVGVSYGMSFYLNEAILLFPEYDGIENKSTKVLIADADLTIRPAHQNKSILYFGLTVPTVSDRHNGGSNVLFCDFHVGWQLKTTLESNYPAWWSSDGL